MIYLLFLKTPAVYFLFWVLLCIGYAGILKKMELSGKPVLIPFFAEKKISGAFFESSTAFWHPFILCMIFAGFGLYLNPFADRTETMQRVTGNLLFVLAFFNYYFFLIRFYKRLADSFGKKLLFKIGLWLFPPLFVLMLGLGKKSVFLHGTPIKLSKFRPKKWFRWLLKAGGTLVFVAEAAVVFLAVGIVSIRQLMPWPIVKYMQTDTHNKTKDIVSDHTEILREENMGEEYALFSSIQPSREKFQPDYSDCEEVVVLAYIIGADLENSIGAASCNIDQIKDATAKGEGLTFVIEAGGSQRWFTDEIPERSVGRYTVKGGKMECVQELDTYTGMSFEGELEDFLVWARENYPAKRTMLVLWDHGGGLSNGFGQDALNRRKDTDYGTLQVDEIVNAVSNSGITFDVIGFDACLMQDIEIALAMEPYADYYLASEETEPSGGWFYTSAFGRLAEDPTLPTEEFAREIVGCYDLYNRIIGDGTDNNKNTLSMVDLSYVKPAYEKLCRLFEAQNAAILEDESNYVDISLSAQNAYTFSNDEQIDLVHYLENLKSVDYDDSVISDRELDELIAFANACVTVRNRISAEGIHGLAFSFPYKMMSSYTNDWKQLQSLNMPEERAFYDDFFSIMAASRKNSPEKETQGFFESLLEKDYTKEAWYQTGFENYVTTIPMINIPIYRNGDGFSLDLSDSVWKIILDSKQFYYQETEEGLKYLGMDYDGWEDADGHPMIATDGTWIMLEGQPIYYEATTSRLSEEGTIFSGISKARLNGSTDVILYIEWEPMNENTVSAKGRIIGYDLAEDEDAFMEKGSKQLQTGDTLDFVFDFYDEEGNVIATKADGKTYRIITSDNITVTDEPIGSCTLQHGLLLTDVYQRKFQSEMVVTEID